MLYEQALDNIQRENEQTEASECLLEETTESLCSQEKGVHEVESKCSLQSGDPGLVHGTTRTSLCSGVQMREVGSKQIMFSGPVGGIHWIRIGGTSREAYLDAWERCGSTSQAHMSTYGRNQKNRIL